MSGQTEITAEDARKVAIVLAFFDNEAKIFGGRGDSKNLCRVLNIRTMIEAETCVKLYDTVAQFLGERR